MTDSAAIRLFSTDIDGTILGDPESANRFKSIWEQIPKHQRPLLCYNSGRMVDDVSGLVQEGQLPDPEYIIGGVGTQVFDFTAAELFKDFNQVLSEGWDLEKVEGIAGGFPGIERQPAELLHAFKSSWYLYDAPPGAIAQLQQQLQGAGLDVEVIYSSQRDLDVLPKKANKGNALGWLCESLSISPEEVLVAGDSGNDTAMFQVDGVRGIAPKNAHPDLRSALTDRRVYLASKEIADGVLEGLVHYEVISEADVRGT